MKNILQKLDAETTHTIKGENKMRTVWVVQEGPYYAGFSLAAFVCHLKKTAISICKRDGYKYNKEQDLYLNETERRWRQLEMIEWENDHV